MTEMKSACSEMWTNGRGGRWKVRSLREEGVQCLTMHIFMAYRDFQRRLTLSIVVYSA